MSEGAVLGFYRRAFCTEVILAFTIFSSFFKMGPMFVFLKSLFLIICF